MAVAINFVVIGILILVGIVAIRLNYLRHRILIILLILLALFLYSSVALVSEQNKIDLKSSGGVFAASKVYIVWLGNGFQNLKQLTAKVIETDWTSINGTFTEKWVDKNKKDKKK